MEINNFVKGLNKKMSLTENIRLDFREAEVWAKRMHELMSKRKESKYV